MEQEMRVLMVCAAIIVALVAPAAAADVQVIAHPGVAVTEVTVDDLKEIFLGTKTELGGGAVQPIFEQSGAAHEAFLKYLGKSDAALRTHFKTLVFTGKGSQPKAFATDAEVLKFVASTKGAIGYVSGSADTAGAKKIQVK
jgi:ABC-type phosphate transport system substrate-binding protein